MKEVLQNGSKTILVSLEDQGIIKNKPEIRVDRALNYLVSSSEALEHVTVQGYFGDNYREIYSRQITSAKDFTEDLAGRLNGNSRLYHVEDFGTFLMQSKKTKREQHVQLNIQKYLDAQEKGVDFSRLPSRVRNIIVSPNTQEAREENLYYLDQILAFFKHFPPFEQISKENRKRLARDSFTFVWIGDRGGVDDISQPYFSQKGNKFTHTPVFF